jgi:bidirectional [NiFe] hydrogenase diaphorase subunit
MLQTKQGPPPTDDKRWRIINGTMRRNGYSPDALIEALHAAQSAFGFLDEDALRYVARELQIPLSRVYGVATFYNAFTLKPEGRHKCILCQGTACYIKGSQELQDAIEEVYHIKPGETTEDGEISLLTARCLGACSLAPAAVVDDVVMGTMEPAHLLETLRKWSQQDER